MKGQTSLEMLALIGIIIIIATSLVYFGGGSNETDAVMSAAYVGAEKATTALNIDYGCTINIKGVSFDAGVITINVNVAGESLDDSVISDTIRYSALMFISQAMSGTFPEEAQPVKTKYYTYDVEVEIERVTR